MKTSKNRRFLVPRKSIRFSRGKKPSVEELKKILEEFKKDPKLVESVKEFVRYHGGNPSR